MSDYSKDDVREIQYWAARSLKVSPEVAQSLDEHLCKMLGIDNPEPIEDPDL